MEAGEPEAVLRAEPDAEVAGLVRQLWEENQRATIHAFLEQTPTVVR